MMKQSSSDSVFEYLRDEYPIDGDGDVDAIALFSYALVELDRIEWRDHYKQSYQADPTPDKVTEWFESKPPSYFEDRQRYALSWFRAFARELLADEIEQNRREAVKNELSNIQSEIQRASRFWPGFWIGNLVGFTSNFIFAIVVVGFVAVINTDFSFASWAKHLFPPHQ
jgi:hypothetical protein